MGGATDSSVYVFLLGLSGAIIIILLAIIGFFARNKMTGLEIALQAAATSLTKFSDDMRAELNRIHERQDVLEQSHSQLLGEHKVMTRRDNCQGG